MKRLRLSAALACAAALLAAVPALAPASVQVGSSGWQWGNPLPQGNTLRSISFAGANGYAAGDFGTLLRTTDGGTTWSGLLSGTFTNLTEVQAIDADAVFAARRLRRAALGRRRRDLHARGLHAGRVQLQGAVRGRLVRQPPRPASSPSPTAPSCAPTTTATPSPRRTRCPGTRAQGGSATPVDLASSPTRSASARPPTARSTARPTARTRGAWSATPTARRALVLLPRRATTASRSATARCSSPPRTAARPGRRKDIGIAADQPALDPLRDADAAAS